METAMRGIPPQHNAGTGACPDCGLNHDDVAGRLAARIIEAIQGSVPGDDGLNLRPGVLGLLIVRLNGPARPNARIARQAAAMAGRRPAFPHLN